MADKLRIVNRALQRIGAKRLSSLAETSRERLAIDAAYDDVVEQELMTNFWTFAIIRREIVSNNEFFAKSADINAGGSGYAVDDVLTLSGGTGTAAQFTVDEVSSGVVTSVSVAGERGKYTVKPTDPVSTTTGGSGTGCTMDVTYEQAPAFGRSYSYNQPSDYLRAAPRDPKDQQFFDTALFEGNKILSDDGGPFLLRYVSDLSDLTVFDDTFSNKEELFHPLFANAVSMRLALEVAEELTGSASKQDRIEAAYTFFVNKARLIDAIEAGPILPDIDEWVGVRTTEGLGDPSIRKYN